MLQMGTPGEQRDFHIRDGSAGQHASVLLFLQMGEHKPLPVPIQNILTAVGGKLQAASPLCRLQQQMDLGVMPERFKVSHTFHTIRNRFLIYNVSGPEFHRHAKSILNQAFQNFNLHFSHNLGLDFLQPLIPYDVQRRLLFLQLPQPGKNDRHLTALRKLHLISQDRLQQRRYGGLLHAQPLSGTGMSQACHGTDRPRLRLVYQLIFISGVYTDLVDLLLPDLLTRPELILRPCIGQHAFYLQASAGYFHIGQTVSLVIPDDFKYFGAEFLRINRLYSIAIQSV